MDGISIHSARVGGDDCTHTSEPGCANFNPLRPCGRRPTKAWPLFVFGYFNPLRPCGRRHLPDCLYLYNNIISIHSARVGGDEDMKPSSSALIISIHSARVGGDHVDYDAVEGTEYISIHSARVGGDLFSGDLTYLDSDFNPLRPCGRRPFEAEAAQHSKDFNPLRPCGRRQAQTNRKLSTMQISIHSARVGGDDFQQSSYRLPCISIHSARVGGDSKRNHFFVS